MIIADYEYTIAENIYGKYYIIKDFYGFPAAAAPIHGNVYEPETIQYIIDHCGDGDIIHAGTFIGDFLPALSKHCKGIVWAFEPNKLSYECARKTVEINDLQNVRLYNLALGPENKTVHCLYKNLKGQTRGGGTQIRQAVEEDRTYKIQQVTLDSFIPQDRKISIFQLDVETYEVQVMRGAVEILKRNLPRIILEGGAPDWIKTNISQYYELKGKMHLNSYYEHIERH